MEDKKNRSDKLLFWSPSVQLRWKTKEFIVKSSKLGIATAHLKDVLQQKWTSDEGTTEWRDVPTEPM